MAKSTILSYTSLVFALSVAGKVVGGVALDRPPRQRRMAALAGCVLLAIGGGLLVRPLASSDGGPLRLGPAQGHAQLVCFALTFGVGYGVAFTLVQSRAAQLYGHRGDFPRLQSALAVSQYLGSFVGVLLTSQLRDAQGGFVRPFALFAPIGLLNCLLCVSVFAGDRGCACRER